MFKQIAVPGRVDSRLMPECILNCWNKQKLPLPVDVKTDQGIAYIRKLYNKTHVDSTYSTNEDFFKNIDVTPKVSNPLLGIWGLEASQVTSYFQAIKMAVAQQNSARDQLEAARTKRPRHDLANLSLLADAAAIHPTISLAPAATNCKEIPATAGDSPPPLSPL